MQRTAPLPDYTYHTTIEYNVLDTKDVRFKNGIEGGQKSAGAETWTHYPNSSTYVSARFYWEDRISDTMGSILRSEGYDGQSSVFGDSLVNTNKKYHKFENVKLINSIESE